MKGRLFYTMTKREKRIMKRKPYADTIKMAELAEIVDTFKDVKSIIAAAYTLGYDRGRRHKSEIRADVKYDLQCFRILTEIPEGLFKPDHTEQQAVMIKKSQWEILEELVRATWSIHKRLDHTILTLKEL